MKTILYDIGYSIHSAFLENTVILSLVSMSKKLIAAAALVIFQRKSIPTTSSSPITQVLQLIKIQDPRD
ncbi:MAG: hypothetical protein ACM3X1_09535 [Ignavibacteriales bacterium]